MKMPGSIASLGPTLAALIVLAVLFVGGSVLYPGFSSSYNAANLLNENAYLAVAAIGATFVILSGGIDLSVGAVTAFCAVLIAKLISGGVHPLAAWATAIAFGVALGTIMGWLIDRFDLPAFMVTLAGMFLARSLAFQVSEQNLAFTHPFVESIKSSVVLPLWGRGSLKAISLLAIGAYALAMLVAHFTPFGRNVYAIGGDENSAKLLGVPVARTRVSVYAIAGLCSALAGIVVSLHKSSGDPAAFVGMELDVIAAVVIGGTLLTGGVGLVAGSLVGVLIQGVIQLLIIFNGKISSWWTKITIGGLLLAFILLQKLIARSIESKK